MPRFTQQPSRLGRGRGKVSRGYENRFAEQPCARCAQSGDRISGWLLFRCDLPRFLGRSVPTKNLNCRSGDSHSVLRDRPDIPSGMRRFFVPSAYSEPGSCFHQREQRDAYCSYSRFFQRDHDRNSDADCDRDWQLACRRDIHGQHFGWWSSRRYAHYRGNVPDYF